MVSASLHVVILWSRMWNEWKAFELFTTERSRALPSFASRRRLSALWLSLTIVNKQTEKWNKTIFIFVAAIKLQTMARWSERLCCVARLSGGEKEQRIVIQTMSFKWTRVGNERWRAGRECWPQPNYEAASELSVKFSQHENETEIQITCVCVVKSWAFLQSFDNVSLTFGASVLEFSSTWAAEPLSPDSFIDTEFLHIDSMREESFYGLS